MPRTPVTADPADPDFPHGEPRGRYRGCRCDRCMRAQRRARKTAELFHHRHGRTIKLAAPAEAQRVADHITRLMALPHVSCEVIAALSGIARNTVSDMVHQTRTPTPRAARAVLAVTVNDVTAAQAFLPKDRYVRLVRGMQALGYPIGWQERQIGRCLQDFIHPRTASVTRSLADAVEALAERVGDIPATPEATGISPSAIGKCRGVARRAGYYPSCCYDDDGNYNARLDPDHPWAIADSRCAGIIEIAGRLAAPDRNPEVDTNAVIAHECGTYVREVERIGRKLGVTWTNPNRGRNLTRARKVLDRIDAEDLDVVRAAIDLGLAHWGTGFAAVPADHPAIGDLAAKKAEEKKEAKQRNRAAYNESKRTQRAKARAARREAEGKAA